MSSQKPFGMRTYVHGERNSFPGAIKLYEKGGIGYISSNQIERNKQWVDTYKVYISAAYNAGDNYPHQIIGKPIKGEKAAAAQKLIFTLAPLYQVKKQTM